MVKGYVPSAGYRRRSNMVSTKVNEWRKGNDGGDKTLLNAEGTMRVWGWRGW